MIQTSRTALIECALEQLLRAHERMLDAKFQLHLTRDYDATKENIARAEAFYEEARAASTKMLREMI